MKYHDLIHFQPIESVIKVQEANEKTKAMELVGNYVISERMEEEIRDHIVPNLQFDAPFDNKGLLIVGNYGTGKSHLMAVISTIAENAEALTVLQNQRVAKSFEAIAGKFHVVRMELGSTKIDLRDAICLELEKALKREGIDYQFPPVNRIINNKESFVDMMGIFHEHFPEQGLLIVVDELLDFLRARNEQEIVLDLGFLREIGELATSTRLRLMAGIQEMLFGNPHFQFVAESIKHVQARFLQFHIVRQDVAYVVSQRILAKTAEQKTWIRQYLKPFMPLYQSLSTDIERFVELFPVHPQFLTTFEQVLLGEKREILRTISDEIRSLLDQDVDESTLRLLSYDSYWDYLDANTALTADPTFDKLKRRTHLALERVEKGLESPQYWPVAQRIIRALAISRLTTDDYDLPLGLTPANLRDDLCLYLPMMVMDMSFLTITINTICEQISSILGHQVILHNETNDQYYLDMGTMVDYDGMLKDKASVLSPDTLNRHYFEALTRILQRTDLPYKPNTRIWRYDVPWLSHNVERPGYLFLGTPNERSTAQPPREFYVYFLPPFKTSRFEDEGRDDDVFFRLAEMNDELTDMLRYYAAARELANDSPSNSPARREYTIRSDRALKNFNDWLGQHFITHFEVVYERQPRRLAGVVKNLNLPSDTLIHEMVPKIAGYFLEKAFERQCAGYPSFTPFKMPVTQSSLESYAKEAIDRIAGKSTSAATGMLLESLGLLEDNKIHPRRSPYAKWVLELMEQQPAPAHLVNRGLLIEEKFTRNGVEDVAYTPQFHLEPVLLLVVLTALVYNGDLVIAAGKVKHDASRLSDWAKLPLVDKIHFSHIERPKEMPLAALIALFDMFDLKPVLIQQENQRETGLQNLQEQRYRVLDEIIHWEKIAQEGIRVWGKSLWSAEEQQIWAEWLHTLHRFLDELNKYNTVGKLVAFSYTSEQINEYDNMLRRLKREFEPIIKRVQEVQPMLTYLDKASQVLPSDDPWQNDALHLKERVVEDLKGDGSITHIKQQIAPLIDHYQEIYFTLHREHRLNKADDERKAQLVSSPEWQALASLKLLPVISGEPFDHLQKELMTLKMCSRLTSTDLVRDPVCPHCHFKPLEEQRTVRDLNWFEMKIQELLDQWTQTLYESLQDPYCQESLIYVDNASRPFIEDFLKSGKLPLPLPRGFVEDIKIVLGGIEAKEVTIDILRKHLTNAKALTAEEAKAALVKVIDDVIRGSDDRSKVRLVFKLPDVD
ncbi:DUF6079 family protein [Sulfobacillus thermosulfidooxidans]|uniref:DUF6079 family protein n=1 Tax=Sulfobacillus thermosulfidooxidans TaxID=28034 RepID=UPI0006B497CC|nr:DUF6079 family protein [Sulfobacillus thermosulfidooxidans]